MASLSSLFILVCLTITRPTRAAWLNRNSISTLPDEVDHTIAACQEDNLSIQCRNRYSKIIIKDVFYGRDNLFTCTSKLFNATKLCDHPTPRNIIEKVHVMCNNENKCKIPVTTKFLQKEAEEICFGIRKYLKVKYACHQEPQLHMVCPNDCNNTCWPLCQLDCCHPPIPIVQQMSNHTNSSKNSQPLVPLGVIDHQVIINPTMHQPTMHQQCGGGCSSQCAPLCQPTCCNSVMPALQFQPMTASSCPGTCSGSCLPLCDTTCCLMHQVNQPIMQPQPPAACPGQCPSQCAPLCSPACCSGPMAMAPQPPPPRQPIVTCPASCPPQCAPACQPSCCQPPPQMMMPLPPPPPPTCGNGCSATCAPLCQPTCCQAMMPPPPPPPIMMTSCPSGCPMSCLPMCQQDCCNQAAAIQPPPQMKPQLTYMSPPVLMQQMIPQQQSMPATTIHCPPMCGANGCQPACPAKCCGSPRDDVAGVKNPMLASDPYEVAQRRTYQQMLTHFRKKQLQRYFQGRYR